MFGGLEIQSPLYMDSEFGIARPPSSHLGSPLTVRAEVRLYKGIPGLGFRGLGFKGLGLRGIRVKGLGFRGLEFGVYSLKLQTLGGLPGWRFQAS